MKVLYVDFKNKRLNHSWEEDYQWVKEVDHAKAVCADLVKTAMRATNNPTYVKQLTIRLGRILEEIQTQAEEHDKSRRYRD